MNANSDREYIDTRVGDVRTAFDVLRVSTTERLTAIHSRFDGVNTQLNALDMKIEGTVEAAKAEIIKWIAGSLIAMIGMFVATFIGMAGLMVNLLSHQPPVTPAAAPINTPAVIIQLTPQGATVLPAAPPAAKP